MNDPLFHGHSLEKPVFRVFYGLTWLAWQRSYHTCLLEEIVQMAIYSAATLECHVVDKT